MILPIWDHDYFDDCIPNFAENMSKPRHRWYEFKEGYSQEFVLRSIRHYETTTGLKAETILDPFSGSGTSPLAGVMHGYSSIAVEVNPFMAFISRVKTKPYIGDPTLLDKELRDILNARPIEMSNNLEGYSTFSPTGNNKKWLFNKSILRGYEAIRYHIETCSREEHQEFFILALYAAMMDCCNARRDGKCLRYKKEWNTLGYSSAELRKCFITHVKKIINDICAFPLCNTKAEIINGDARAELSNIGEKTANVIAFSPPYLNSFDYSDVYRPELFLGGYTANNDQLRELRAKTLRSHVQYNWDIIEPCVSPWVTDIVTKIEARRELLWNKNIPTMIKNYFADMSVVFNGCYRVAKNGATMWFIVSTSAYAGVEIPVDLMLADIAVQSGWELESINALRNLRTSSQYRDSNIKKIRLRESMVACRKR